MELNDIAIGIPDEKEGGTAKLHRLCYSDATIIKLSLHRLHVGYL